MSAPATTVRVFADSNVFVEGLFSPWSNSRAILILARAGMFRLVLSPYVKDEVEGVLLRRFGTNPEVVGRLIDDYDRALGLLEPEMTGRISREEFNAHRALIRHGHDVPVLVTAIKARPDWLVTSNIDHFPPEVATRTGLRIVTPPQFLRL
ncbi:MAG TPA: PIN domain-containing protein, partial [Acidobacteriota bacterium]|nr:PIN domain-containing protein [Acidobacteriota bacterium]